MNTETTISERIDAITARITAAAQRSGRSLNDVTLCAVTKTVPIDRILEAVKAGILNIGENYYQEARGKLDLLPPDVRKHFIGHLQSNKAKYVVGSFDVIQSVDSISLANEINRQATNRGLVQAVLLEVKLEDVETKAGVAPNEVARMADAIANLPSLALCGLMGMPPPVVDAEEARPYFALVRQLFDALPTENRLTLSMGMTGDFEVAIEEGATLVRIGSAIFGRRN